MAASLDEMRVRGADASVGIGPRLWPVVLALPAVLVGAFHASRYWLPFEDAFITYRYAENLAHGRGLVFNVGERVEGCSSLGWTLLLSVTSTLRLPIVATSQWLSLLFGLCLLVLVSVLAARLCDRDTVVCGKRARAWLIAGAPMLLALDGTFAYYAASGMETTAFSLSVLVAIASLLLPAERARRWLVSSLAVAVLLRPEGIGYAALVLVALALASETRRLAWMSAAMLAPMLITLFAWRLSYFGHLLPNTYYAKASPSGALVVVGLRVAERFLTTQMAWLPFIAAIVLGIGRREPALRAAALVVVGSLGNVVIVGGDAFAFHRFFLPALGPAAAVYALTLALGLSQVPRVVQLTSVCARWLIVAGATLASGLVPMPSITTGTETPPRDRVLGKAAIDVDYFAVGRWLRDHAPADALLATNAAGIVPFVSGLRTIDMLGLTDAHIAHVPIKLGRGAAGHEKYDAAYVLSRNPDVILLGLPVRAKRPVKPEELSRWVGQWFAFLPGDEAIWNAESFRARYAPLGVAVEGKWLVLFVRRDGKLAAMLGAP